MTKREWLGSKDGTLDMVSNDGLRAVYKRTHGSGYALYWTFEASSKKRRQLDAMCVGGLPDARVIPFRVSF